MSAWWLRSKNASSTPTNSTLLTKTEARKFCLSEDRGRERYLKKYFNADINDPLLYHLIINTGLVNYDDAAKLIGDAVLNLH
jgi:cytidylate kinase